MEIEFNSFHAFGHEISLVKGGPRPLAGGPPSRQFGGPRSAGGECFAPYLGHSLLEREGVRSTLLQVTEYDHKSQNLIGSENCPGLSVITLEHSSALLVNPRHHLSHPGCKLRRSNSRHFMMILKKTCQRFNISRAR